MRDPTILLWPDDFAPVNMTVTIDRPVFKGPKPLDGREQVVSSSAGGWLISYEGIPVFGSDTRWFRSLWLSIGGMAKALYVKPEFSPNMLAKRNNISVGTAAYSNSSIFSDGSQFNQSTGDCTLTSAAGRGDISISVNNSSVSTVQAGDYIEINGRLHVVREISGTSWNIWPPLRASYSSGTAIEIDDPRCLVYLTTDSRFLANNVDFGRLSRVSVDFIEANW